MKVETFLPLFSGYYGTIHDQQIDSEIERELDELDLDFDDAKITYDKEDLNKVITDKIMSRITDDFSGLIMSYEYQKLVSPQEYNFTNDSIEIELEINLVKLIELLTDDKKAFQDWLTEHYTSPSGFTSFYTANFGDWIRYLKWGKELPHKVGACLNFLLSEPDLEYELFSDDSEYNEAISESVTIEKEA